MISFCHNTFWDAWLTPRRKFETQAYKKQAIPSELHCTFRAMSVVSSFAHCNYPVAFTSRVLPKIAEFTFGSQLFYDDLNVGPLLPFSITCTETQWMDLIVLLGCCQKSSRFSVEASRVFTQFRSFAPVSLLRKSFGWLLAE